MGSTRSAFSVGISKMCDGFHFPLINIYSFCFDKRDPYFFLIFANRFFCRRLSVSHIKKILDFMFMALISHELVAIVLKSS